MYVVIAGIEISISPLKHTIMKKWILFLIAASFATISFAQTNTKQEKANALQLLERMDALDLAEMLGLVDGQ